MAPQRLLNRQSANHHPEHLLRHKQRLFAERRHLEHLTPCKQGKLADHPYQEAIADLCRHRHVSQRVILH